MSHNLGNGIHMTVKGSHGYCAIKTIEVDNLQRLAQLVVVVVLL